MKLWERVVGARLRAQMSICDQQLLFHAKMCTTNAIFALRMLRNKYRESQKYLHCVFTEKAYDRVPKEKLWYCMRKSGVVENYSRAVQDNDRDPSGRVRLKGKEIKKVEDFK